MKWNQLAEKAQVKLLVDLRCINVVAVTNYAYVTPAELDMVAPIIHKANSVFTIYPDNLPDGIELFNEQTDDVLFMDYEADIPAHFEVL